MWLTLNDFSLGQLLLGIIIALFSSWIMRFLEPEKITIKSWRAVFLLIFRVFIDSIIANISVVRFVLTKKLKSSNLVSLWCLFYLRVVALWLF